ncbi:MAG: DMT family transporter [Burkholderiales bacterium]|nr:DMT family transporter [Burkholderiales bacterium]
MTATSYRAWGIALALAGVVSFSFRPILIKLAYAYVTDPVTLLALRMVFSLPFFVAAALWLRRDSAVKPAPLSRRDLWTVLFLGFLGYYLASFLDFLGLQYISAGVGRLMLFLYPTITVLLSALFLGKRVSAREVVALVVSYAGLALVLSRAFGGDNRNLLLGALLVFGSAVSYAVYLVTSSQVVRRIGSMRFTAYATSVASVLCIAQFLLLRPLSALDLPPQVYGLAAAMGVLCTVLPVFMTSEALKRIGANHVAIIGAAGPVTTIFLGWLGLEEHMTALQIVGAVLVLGGVMLVTIKPRA